MSDVETWRGKLRKHPQTLIEFLKEKDDELDYRSECPRDTFYENFWQDDSVKLIGDVLYICYDLEDLQYKDIYMMSECPDGSYEFLVQYYNGGQCMEEALATAMIEMRSKDE